MPEFLSLAAAFAAVIGFPFLWRIFRTSEIESWSAVPGKIESVNVTSEGSTSGPNQKAEIGYSYEVEKEFYSGYFARLFWTEQGAWDFVTPLQGCRILVHYKPGRPEKSAVSEKELQVKAQEY